MANKAADALKKVGVALELRCVEPQVFRTRYAHFLLTGARFLPIWRETWLLAALRYASPTLYSESKLLSFKSLLTEQSRNGSSRRGTANPIRSKVFTLETGPSVRST